MRCRSACWDRLPLKLLVRFASESLTATNTKHDAATYNGSGRNMALVPQSEIRTYFMVAIP